MVKNIPHVNVTHEPGIVSRVLNTDQTLGCVIECKKGVPNQPVLISNPGMLKREFGVAMDAYWAAGGGPMYVARAAYGDPIHATHYIKDKATTPCNVMKLQVKRPGSKPVHITFKSVGTGAALRLSLTLEEEDGITEYFLGVRRSLVVNEDGVYRPAIENLVDKVNSQSDIANAFYKVVADANTTSPCPAETTYGDSLKSGESAFVGSASYTNITRKILGSGTGNVMGTDGDEAYIKAADDQKPFDNITDDVITDDLNPDVGSSPVEIAHANALKGLENVEISGVFCLKSNPYQLLAGDVRGGGQTETSGDVYTAYVDHIAKMNTPEMHSWRFGILGANDNMTMEERLTQAGVFNNELIVFVGQGLVDVNGTEYPPELATMAVAGKIAATTYNIAIWGGRSSKVLRVDRDFIADILPIAGEAIYEDADADPLVIVGENVATRTEMIAYNEAGVLTFLKDKDGVKITEGITTVQEYYASLGIRREDEIAVMRVIIHAKYEVYDACYKMLGQGLNDTFKSDLENSVRSRMAIMSDEGSLSDYEAAAFVGPDIGGEQGEIKVNISITPVHAARIINAVIVVL